MPNWKKTTWRVMAMVVICLVVWYMPIPASVAGVLMYVKWPLLVLGLSAWEYFEIKRAAKKLVTDAKTIYAGDMEYAPVSPENFPWLDRTYYESATLQMEAAGFRCLGDVECLTMSRQYPSMRTFLRVFSGEDGNVMAAVYQVKVRGVGLMKLLSLLGLISGDVRTVDMETEFSDGTFWTTVSSPLAGKYPDFHGIGRRVMDPSDPVVKMLAVHRQAVAQMCGSRNIEAQKHATLEAVLGAQNRMHALKSAHKKKNGYITRAELERVAGRPLGMAEQALAREVEKQQEDR